MDVATPAKPATRASRPRERRIMIREPNLLDQPLQQAEAKTLDKDKDLEIKRKDKKLMKKATMEPSSESTPSPVRRALLEAGENRLREEAWVQK